MLLDSNVLGIDIGSVSISIAELNPQKAVVQTAYLFHQGSLAKTLEYILPQFDLARISSVAITSSTPSIIKATKQYDNRIAIITAAKHFNKQVGSILLVGGEKFGLILFDQAGNYLNYKANTSCAAGTGSFLDQQARRLNLGSIEALSEIAFQNTAKIPRIASRCAVFAKTDLIHAQQEGYSLAQISDGLCYGLAKNIIDTLFKGMKPSAPLLFCGGVSKNRAVVSHISDLLKMEIMVDDLSHLYGAIGAALNLIDEGLIKNEGKINSPLDIIIPNQGKKRLYYPPLELKLSDYPDFHSFEQYEYVIEGKGGKVSKFSVEVDIYQELKRGEPYEVYLGIDIGSTSTKAVLIDREKKVLAGFYTKTAGSPVQAFQAICEAMDNFINRKMISLQVIATGTTGSGRKFIGKIIGADLVIDEITAHARAACELNPGVDTIIEIGGQDAKFTTLKNGMVTSSIMNNVCAAGTGSFIEEQAQKLGCSLADIPLRTEQVCAPLSSDRCTVFMERDINHYLNEGCSINEALASVLHSVRENYLYKVANEVNIGNTILFQGATAKNKALVAAFEQRLHKPIQVSKYCHLTGALGTALVLVDEGISSSRFRGIDLYKRDIPLCFETCELCTNHCKISLAQIKGEIVAYGFLCGRDYDTQQFVPNNNSGFDLMRERDKAFRFEAKTEYREEFTIGLPAGLYLFEDLRFWEKFFALLSLKTVNSLPYKEALKDGKAMAGAEFCAPTLAMYGQVKYLMDKADYIFLPFYFENKLKEKGGRRQYCYYSQFMPAFVSANGHVDGHSDSLGDSHGPVFLRPVVKYLYTHFHTRVQLYRMLQSITNKRISFFEVSAAYDQAIEFKNTGLKKLQELYKNQIKKTDDIHVVFVGRPYTVLSSSMNNGLPNIFNSLGIKTFYQDMLAYTKDEVKSIKPLLDEIHWEYAAKILEATVVIAGTKGAYPVLITSFKCSPDSFVMDYFKKIMEAQGKPYLILQLDEYDSSTGYETRIEAAIRAFRNHFTSQSKIEKISVYQVVNHYQSVNLYQSLNSNMAKEIIGKTIVIPNWDPLTCPLLAANLRREGFEALVAEETQESIKKSLRYNTGQCIPLNAIAQDYLDCIEKNNLDPAKTILWISKSEIACNIKLYPHHLKSILHAYGQGLSKAGVYVGELSFIDLSVRAAINTYFAYMFGGLVRKVACKIRPYELDKGQTDRVLKKSLKILTDAFLGKRTKEDAVAEIVSHFEWINTRTEKKPKIAIFGDIYVRDNEVMNQNLIHFIEDNGGEVVTTPYHQYAKMIAGAYFRKWFIEGKYLGLISLKALLSAMTRLEKTYYKYFERVLNEPDVTCYDTPVEILSQYNVLIENTGESMDNLLKIAHIKKQYPDLSLFVQASPSFCCPSLITEAMSGEIEKKTGVPVVSITYDGTGGNKNDLLIPYLKYPRKLLPQPKNQIFSNLR